MPAAQPEPIHDVFISYSHFDQSWVWDWLVPRLKSAGFRVCTDRESFPVGVPALINMENAVTASRHTLLVLTPTYLNSEWAMYEQILTQTRDPIGLRQRTIPVLLQPCDLPPRIAMLTYADLTGKRDEDAEFDKIVRAIRGTAESAPQPPTPPKPLPPNPFSGGPATDEDLRFVGRQAELKQLQLYLQHGSVALTGSFRIGLSSLLRRLAHDSPWPVIGPINCQALVDKDDLYACIAEGLGLSDGDWRSIRAVLRQREVLLLIDEFDAAPALGVTITDLARFRAVAEENRCFHMVVVAHRPLKELFPHRGPDSPGYTFLQPLPIGPLSDADAWLLLSHPWAPHAPQFDGPTAEQLLKLACGFPFKLHRAAFHRYQALVDPAYDWEAAYQRDVRELMP